MTPRLRLLLPVVALATAWSGCGSSSSVVQPMPHVAVMGGQRPLYYAGEFSAGTTEIPWHLRKAIKGHLDVELQKAGLAAAGDYSNRLRIDGTVTYYRRRGELARKTFGVFAGQDGVTCDVKLVDGDGANMGRLTVESHNRFAAGSEDDVAQMAAAEIVKAFNGAQK